MVALSTSWSKVFDKFLSLIDDRTLAVLAEEDMTELLSIFLNGGVSLYFKKCKKDLSLYTEPEFLRESSNGTGAEHNFTISQGISSFNADSVEMYCEVDGVEITEDTDYTYTDATKTFYITNAPSNGIEVTRGYNMVGFFTEDLSDQELWVIAYSMLVIWYSSKLYNLEKLKNRLSSKDFNNFSPANLLQKLSDLHTKSRREIKRLTIDYSYDNFTGFN